MINLNTVLNERIARVARKQIKGETGTARRLIAQHRRDLAALKRVIAELRRRLGAVEKYARKSGGAAPPAEKIERARFRADGLRTHRSKLGFSAASYAKLVGVSPLTIYQWESGKSRPRRAQLAKLVTIRGMGKREAVKRLGSDE